MSEAKKPRGLDIIKAKRLDGPRAGEEQEFLRINFDKMTKDANQRFGKWEVVSDPEKPKASKPAAK
jgi:hypothetical protein